MGKFKNVCDETQYQRILEKTKGGPRGKYTFSSERCELFQYREAFTSENGSVVYPFEPARVGDLLDEHRVDEMMSSNPRVPVFIDNRPGKGKNYFILKILLKIIVALRVRMLILTPRLLLKNQTKIDLIVNLGIDLDLYTDKRIETDHSFGPVDVYSYQELANLISLDGFKMRTDYSVVIFDEVQFFSQDSDFNCSTELVFDYLTSTFIRDGILRIYMTGTPDRIYDRIEVKEKQYIENRQPANLYNIKHGLIQRARPTMYYYHFDSDYSYVNPIFFTDGGSHRKLIEMIASSSEYKWLIFVESSAKGKDLIAKLPYDKKKIFINSEIIHSENNPEVKDVIDKLVKKSEMPVDVLVITKCLDVGVNVKTKNVNIVCYLRDKIDFLQAIGRKRIDEDAKEQEIVSLYIPDRCKEDIKQWYAQIEKTYNEYRKEIHLKPIGKPCSVSSLESPFYVDQGKLFYNSFTMEKLYYQMKDYERLLDEIEKSPDEPVVVIRKYILSWIPGAKCAYDENGNDVGNDPDHTAMGNKIYEIIREYAVKTFNDEEFNELVEKLKSVGAVDPRKDQRSDRSSWSTQTVNNLLKKYNISYRLECKSGKYTCVPVQLKETKS